MKIFLPKRLAASYRWTRQLFWQPVWSFFVSIWQSFVNYFRQEPRNFYLFLIFLIVNSLVRFYNFPNSLYFIWDQGRDAWAIDAIVRGDLTLIGPTSGLPGFFLGPLWFYLGVPGFLLSGGSPYGIAAGYMLMSLLGLPLMWLLARKLFSNPWLAAFTAWLMAFHEGSIMASLYIWNPLIAVPLMAAAYLAFLSARRSRKSLALAFLLLALNLQSEFAYAIFFVVTLWLLIPWIRQRICWKDFFVATGTVVVTVIPQLLFELRNGFIMTQSLWKALLDKDRLITWSHLWATRPLQLWLTTQKRLFGSNSLADEMMWLAAVLALTGVFWWWRQQRSRRQNNANSQARVTKQITVQQLSDQQNYAWQLLGIFAVVPYGWYLFWRGNYGHFFDYYLTAHFLFLIPWIVKGAQAIWVVWRQQQQQRRFIFALPTLATILFFFMWFTLTSRMVWQIILKPHNEAGLRSMEQSIETLFSWQQQDQSGSVFRIFTPNLSTENYDYIMHWYAKQHQLPIPRTVRYPQDQVWYVLIEPDRQAAEIRFEPWYQQATEEAVLVRRKKSGVNILETWMTPELARELGLQPLNSPISDVLPIK